ncbi:MAG: hypothetical protein ABI224_17765 [Acetobacteraceae bacterium]
MDLSVAGSVRTTAFPRARLLAPAKLQVAAARRRALLHRFAVLAAGRLAAMEDPAGVAGLRAALRAE